MLKYVVCLVTAGLLIAGPAQGYVWVPSLQGHGTKDAGVAERVLPTSTETATRHGRNAGEGKGKGAAANAKSVQDAGQGARGTDELKQACLDAGGIYLSTNGECINVPKE